MKKIVIIGAGIVGATAAYNLARAGLDVTIIDCDKAGKSTSAAAGIICPWITKRRNKAWYELARQGAAYLETTISDLHNDGEDDTKFKKVGAIRLHTDKEKLFELKEIAIKRRELAPQMGEISLLSKEETQEKFPLLNGSYYSLFIEGAARIDGKALCNSLISAAKKHGAAYIEEKAEIIHRNESVTGVKAGAESLDANVVIATNGVWMPELLKPLQVNLKISAQKGEIIHLQTDSLETSSLPVIMPPNNQHILNFDDGKIVIGATHATTTDFNMDITVEGVHYVLDEALKVAPSLKECSIIETRVGFRPFTYNHLPIFGPVPQIDGLLIANGLGASGLTTGPFIGKQLSRIVVGDEPEVDLDHYHVGQAIIS